MIHPLFIIACLVAIFCSAMAFFIALVVAVILHELAHMLVAKQYCVVASNITLTPFGGVLNLESKILSSRQKIIIYLAGPCANLVFSMLFGVMVWLFPVAFIYLEYLVVANFLVGIINLLPIYPLDGGKILSQYVSAKRILLFSNLIFSIVLATSLIVFNWWWIVFAVVILIQINWEYKQSVYFDKFVYKCRPKIGKFVRCAVLSTTSLWEAYRLINSKQPTEFIVTDHKNQVFYEKDLEQWLLKNDSSTLLEQCL